VGKGSGSGKGVREWERGQEPNLLAWREDQDRLPTPFPPPWREDQDRLPTPFPPPPTPFPPPGSIPQATGLGALNAKAKNAAAPRKTKATR
jgi:hypothetical protein